MNKTTTSLVASCIFIASAQAGITQTITNTCYASYLRFLSNETLVSKAQQFYKNGRDTVVSTHRYFKHELATVEDSSACNKAITQHVNALSAPGKKYPFISYIQNLIATREKVQSLSNTISLITDELERRTELKLQSDNQKLYEELENLFFDLSDLDDNLAIINTHCIEMDAFKKEWNEKQFAILSHQDQGEKEAHHQILFDERHQNHITANTTQSNEAPQQESPAASATFQYDYELGFTDFV